MLNPSPSLPYFDVFVNGTTTLPQYTPCVQIIQRTNAHPIALLDVVYTGTNTNTATTGAVNSWMYLKEGTPIQINYGQRPYFVYPFLGYVSSYKLIRSNTDPANGNVTMTRVQYTIVGTSQIMQSTNNVAWKHSSPSTIVGNIANNNGFRGIIHTYQAAINYRLQNVSDFRFVSQLADEIGYRFYVDNTDLYFINPQQLLDRNTNRAVPKFWSNNLPGVYDTVVSFNPLVGTITPDGGVVAQRNVIALNPNTGQITQATNTPILTASANSSTTIGPQISKYYNEAPAESYYEAQQKATADYHRNLYWNIADAELWGDARVKPNTVVNITGTSIPENDAGLWLVQSATHTLTKAPPTGTNVANTYYIQTELVRDQIYTASTTTFSDASAVTQAAPPKLIGGRWRSSNLGATIYAT